MRLKFLMTTTLAIYGFLLVLAVPITSTLAQSQDQSRALAMPIMVEPTLMCERAATRPGLHLRITNSSASSIPAGRTIQFSYELTPASLNGEGKVQLRHTLLSGQTIDVSLGEIKTGPFQACSAILLATPIIQGPVIKLPYGVAPRKP